MAAGGLIGGEEWGEDLFGVIWLDASASIFDR